MKLDMYALDGLCIKVYDPSKQEVIGTYRTYGEASKKLGLPAKILREASITKTRRYCKRLNMEIAIRVSSIDKKILPEALGR